MTFEEKINFLKNKWEANKMAIISDVKNNQYFCAINHDEKSKYFALNIYLYDIELVYKGSMSIFRDPNARLFLSSIYIYWDSRGLGLASKLNNLSNFILRKEAGKIIRGRFSPYNNPQDLNLPKDLTKDEQMFFAEKFYKSNGYEILKASDFKKDPHKHPELNNWDFKFGETPAEIIVVKKIPQLKTYPFKEEDGFITEIEPEEELEK